MFVTYFVLLIQFQPTEDTTQQTLEFIKEALHNMTIDLQGYNFTKWPQDSQNILLNCLWTEFLPKLKLTFSVILLFPFLQIKVSSLHDKLILEMIFLYEFLSTEIQENGTSWF